MSEHPTFVPVSGITLADAPTEGEPSRHRLVRNCRYTLGPVEGRDSECSYCLEDLAATDYTVTHNECLNAFHDHCFDEVLKTNPNLLTPNPVPSKCPFCNGLLYPWPALVGPLPPAEAAVREQARQQAAAELQRRERRAEEQAQRAFTRAATGRVLAANPGMKPEFDLLDEMIIKVANWTPEDRARRDSAIGRLRTISRAAGDGDTRNVIHAKLQGDSRILSFELTRTRAALARKEARLNGMLALLGDARLHEVHEALALLDDEDSDDNEELVHNRRASWNENPDDDEEDHFLYRRASR